MTNGARSRALPVLALAAAAAWPFLLDDPLTHRAGVQTLVLLLLGLSLVVTVGWLRSPTLHQPAALAAGAGLTVWLLAAGQGVPLALVAALAGGALVGILPLGIVRGPSRAGLLVASLLLTLVAWAVIVPAVRPRSFGRPVLLGVDLAGDRPLYLAALGLAVLALAALRNLHRSDLGRRLITVGASPDLAARSGFPPSTVRAEGFALSGSLAGLAGLVAALLQQGMPPTAQLSPTAAVAILAVPFVGGAVWPIGAVVGAAALALGSRLAGPVDLPHPGVAAAALVVALLWLPGGLVQGARARLARFAGANATRTRGGGS